VKISLVVAVSIGFLTTGCLVSRSAVRERQSEISVQDESKNLKAQQSAQMVEVDEAVRILRGRVEEMENNLNQLQMQSRAVESDRQKDAQAYNEKLRVYQETLSRLESQYLAMAQKVESMSSAPTAKAATSSASNKGQFEEAEALFNKKNWRLAAVEYDKYRKKYPNGKNYLEATYKIGFCFHELGMKDQAKSFYEEVIEKSPKSKLAGSARQRLKILK
jgi:TolA-binding protein